MFCHKFSDNFDECKSVCKEEIFGPCEVPDEGSGSSGTISASFSETASNWDDDTNPDGESKDSNDFSDDNFYDHVGTDGSASETGSHWDHSHHIDSDGSASETGSGCVEWASDNCYMDKSCWVSEPMARLDGGKIRHDLLCGRLAHTPRVDTPGQNKKMNVFYGLLHSIFQRSVKKHVLLRKTVNKEFGTLVSS